MLALVYGFDSRPTPAVLLLYCRGQKDCGSLKKEPANQEKSFPTGIRADLGLKPSCIWVLYAQFWLLKCQISLSVLFNFVICFLWMPFMQLRLSHLGLCFLPSHHLFILALMRKRSVSSIAHYFFFI
eukprot:c6777_g1_i2 orf=303-683(-)